MVFALVGDEREKMVDMRLANWFAGHLTQHSDDADSNTNNGVLGYLHTFCGHFVLGSIAGGVGASSVYPVDFVKTHM